MKRRWMARLTAGAVAGIALAGCGGGGLGINPITQHVALVNLVSNKPGAAVTDANLVNAWGVAFNQAAGTLWVADNGTGKATAYDGTGALKLTVTIPAPPGVAGPSNPTGIVGNTTTDFQGDKFIFVTESGTIAGWQSGVTAVIRKDNSATGAIYKGATIANGLLYVANFHTGAIGVYDKDYAPMTLAGNFTGPTLPAGFAPFNVQALGGRIYVAYAKQDAAMHGEIAGAGLGAVEVFDTQGHFIRELAQGGLLNAPWGLALAPKHFGNIGGALLVGNFGDGRVTVLNPSNGAVLGQLQRADGTPLPIDGLWGLASGSLTAGGAEQLFFAAGPNGESDGLAGQISAVP